MSRAHIADIWRRGSRGEPLAGEDETIFRALREHPEYAEVWERAGELADKDVEIAGTNPFLHVALHAVIEHQIASRTPPAVEQALFRLTRGGLTPHEGIHRILAVFGALMEQVLRQGKPFDAALYERRLRALEP